MGNRQSWCVHSKDKLSLEGKSNFVKRESKIYSEKCEPKRDVTNAIPNPISVEPKLLPNPPKSQVNRTM